MNCCLCVLVLVSLYVYQFILKPCFVPPFCRADELRLYKRPGMESKFGCLLLIILFFFEIDASVFVLGVPLKAFEACSIIRCDMGAAKDAICGLR